MEWMRHIEQKQEVLCGKPVIRGTRLSVELILEHLGAGWTEQDLLDNYPNLRLEHIRAALLYAAHALSLDRWIILQESVAA